MEDIKICAACQFGNALSNSVCERCGTPILALLPAKTTIPVPENLIQAIPLTQDAKKQKASDHKNAIAFYMVGREEPVMVNDDVKKIIFGRHSPGESTPTVDLSPFDAHLFGVSRQHAIIHRSDNGCFLQDLGSTNGTWLNEKRLIAQKLYALENGDLVRLGQFGFRAYFETAKTVHTLGLVDEVTPGQRLTPGYLEKRLTPYVVALANAQQLLDAMQDRPLSVVSILKIEAEDNGRISVTVTGARDIIRLVEAQLTQWRTSRMILIERLRELNERVKADVRSAQEVKPISAPLLKDMRQQLTDFVSEQVEQLAPNLSDSNKNTYAAKLTAPLQTLLFSPLQPVVIENQSKVSAAETD